MDMPQWLIDHATDMPLIAMLLFMGIGVVVTIYILTDRRRAHDAHMSAMALDDQAPRHDH